MTDPRSLAERVRDIARSFANSAGMTANDALGRLWADKAATLHEAADALEARKDQP